MTAPDVCCNGHPVTAEGSIIDANGRRYCRECRQRWTSAGVTKARELRGRPGRASGPFAGRQTRMSLDVCAWGSCRVTIAPWHRYCAGHEAADRTDIKDKT